MDSYETSDIQFAKMYDYTNCVIQANGNYI